MAFDSAVASTRATTLAPYGNAFAGSNTRTVSLSAQRIVPLTSLPFTSTWNARGGLRRGASASVKRTETSSPRSMPLVPARGRNRTTDGATTVRASSAGSAATARTLEVDETVGEPER